MSIWRSLRERVSLLLRETRHSFLPRERDSVKHSTLIVYFFSPVQTCMTALISLIRPAFTPSYIALSLPPFSLVHRRVTPHSLSLFYLYFLSPLFSPFFATPLSLSPSYIASPSTHIALICGCVSRFNYIKSQ